MKVLMVVLCAVCAALLLASSSVPSAHAACSNEAIRTEQGPAALALPDCRAYEYASPGSSPSVTKETTIEGSGGGKSSPEGNALSYYSRYPAKGSQSSSETWLSRRTATGWSVVSLDPQLTPSPTQYGPCQPGVALSEDLSSYLLSAGGALPPSTPGECGVPAEELVEGEPRGYSNLYLRLGAGPYALVNSPPAGVDPANATYQAASSDLSRIVFSEQAMLTPNSSLESRLFMWVDGVIRAIGVLPNGQHVSANLGAPTEPFDEGGGGNTSGLAPVSHAVSADGERVFFEANGNLYLRKNAGQTPAATANCQTSEPTEPGLACTRQLDISKGAGVSGGGVFQFASRDGDRVFFTSDHALTFPASAQPGKSDLYEYDVSAKTLVNLSVASGEAADVRGISGGSDDGSHLYFVARGVLTGAQQNSQGEVAQAGEPNLYLAREGALTYVATFSPWEPGGAIGILGGKDWENWWEKRPNSAESRRLKTAWSPSGQYLMFDSHKALTGFDSTPAEPGLCASSGCREVFLYDAEAEDLTCISCNTEDDARPRGNTRLIQRQEFARFLTGPRYLPRAVLDSGQAFFDTLNPLSPRDVNGFQDVYQYRAGEVNLISSGSAVGGSAFIDASADGRNVFFVTPQSLVRSDTDGLPSIYDARIDGGFLEPPPPAAPCAGEGCRPLGPAPPSGGAPSTAAFAGPGNVRPRQCKRGQVRRGDRCVKKKSQRRQSCGKRSSAGKKAKCKDRREATTRQQRSHQSGRKN